MIGVSLWHVPLGRLHLNKWSTKGLPKLEVQNRLSVEESLLIAICKSELPGQEAVGDLHLDSFGPVKVHSFSGLSLRHLLASIDEYLRYNGACMCTCFKGKTDFSEALKNLVQKSKVRLAKRSGVRVLTMEENMHWLIFFHLFKKGVDAIDLFIHSVTKWSGWMKEFRHLVEIPRSMMCTKNMLSKFYAKQLKTTVHI